MSEAVLRMRALHAGYAGREVLSDVDLDLVRGEWLALVGPNGSGKSTLLGCAAGCLKPISGSVEVAGFPLATEPLAAKQRLGYAVAPERLPDLLTGRQCLQVHAVAKGLDAGHHDWRALADELRLDGLLDDPVGIYSYGTRQKLAVLLALLGEPQLIVLDEAFNGLDLASAQVLKRHLRQRLDTGRCAIVFATHALDIVERCADRVMLLHEGRAAGSWDRSVLHAVHTGAGLESMLAEAIRAATSGAQAVP